MRKAPERVHFSDIFRNLAEAYAVQDALRIEPKGAVLMVIIHSKFRKICL